MKHILVVYYTQSGQLKEIIDSLLSKIKNYHSVMIDYEQLKPVNNYPFPWGNAFFNDFPEAVMGIPCDLKPLTINKKVNYDLVILAYQSWFLSPAIPISSFLQLNEVQSFLRGKNVLTLLGIRNMWYSSHDMIKSKLSEMGVHHVGNIVLADRHNNWIAGITIIRWLAYGKRGPTALLPRAGVSEKDIRNASSYGDVIFNAIQLDSYADMQSQLIPKGAVQVKFNLMMIEKNARKIFVKFARIILKNGSNNPGKRARGIKIFKYYLLFALFILSPVVSVIFLLMRYLLFNFANKKIKKYQSV